jgi:hypothetical protein
VTRVAERMAELREAGQKLRRRPARETLALLAQVLEGWRDAASPWRRELVARLPAATGIHPATLREGLDRGLASWSGEALQALVRDELGGPEALDTGAPQMASGFPQSAVLLAGSIPMPSLLALLAPLVLRSPLLAKSASRDPVTPGLVARSVAETDPELGACLTVLDFPGRDAVQMDALLQADCVVASGSDETLAQVAARVAPPRRLVAYGHRVSVAVLDGGATRAALADVAARAALDVCLWDQLGCLSPIALYVVGGDAAAPDRTADAVAEALALAEARWPRGEIDTGSAAAVERERAEAELRAAAGRRVAVHASSGTRWTVVREEDARLRPAPLHRFLRVLPVRGPGELLDALRPLEPYLAGVALEGFGGRSAALARELADRGASRICPFGALQAPPLDWRRDGRGVLLPLARLARREGPAA